MGSGPDICLGPTGGPSKTVCEARGQKTLAGAPYIRVAHCGFSAVSPLTLEHWFISLVLNVGQTGQRPVSFYLSIQSAVRPLTILAILNGTFLGPAASIFYMSIQSTLYMLVILNGTFKFHLLMSCHTPYK